MASAKSKIHLASLSGSVVIAFKVLCSVSPHALLQLLGQCLRVGIGLVITQFQSSSEGRVFGMGGSARAPGPGPWALVLEVSGHLDSGRPGLSFRGDRGRHSSTMSVSTSIGSSLFCGFWVGLSVGGVASSVLPVCLCFLSACLVAVLFLPLLVFLARLLEGVPWAGWSDLVFCGWVPSGLLSFLGAVLAGVLRRIALSPPRTGPFLGCALLGRRPAPSWWSAWVSDWLRRVGRSRLMSRLLFPSDLPLPTFLCPSSAGVSCFSFPSFLGCVVCLCCVLFREASLPLPGWLFPLPLESEPPPGGPPAGLIPCHIPRLSPLCPPSRGRPVSSGLSAVDGRGSLCPAGRWPSAALVV